MPFLYFCISVSWIFVFAFFACLYFTSTGDELAMARLRAGQAIHPLFELACLPFTARQTLHAACFEAPNDRHTAVQHSLFSPENHSVRYSNMTRLVAHFMMQHSSLKQCRLQALSRKIFFTLFCLLCYQWQIGHVSSITVNIILHQLIYIYI